MDRYRKLLNNTFLLFIGNFGSKILAFFMVRYYTEVYSNSEYGIVDLMTTTAGFVVPLITLGINEAVFRFSIDDVENRTRIYSSSLLIAVIGNALFGLFCILINFDSDIFTYKYYLLLYCATDSLYLLTANYCRGIERTSLFAWTGIFHSVVQIIVAILAISVWKQGILGYFIAFAIANVLSCILIWCKLNLFNNHIKDYSLNWVLLKQMLLYSTPLIINTCCWWVMASLDKYIIALQIGSDANGLYAAASKIPAVITTISVILFQAWQISSVTEMNSSTKSKFYSEIHDLIYVAIAIISSFLLFLLKPIHSILVGKDFVQAWVYTPFLIIAMDFSCLASFYGSNYVAMKKTKGALWTSAVAAAVNVVLNIILTRLFGMHGTAFATMISYLVLWVIRLINTRSFVIIRTNVFKQIATFLILGTQATIICVGYYSIWIELLLFAVLVLIHFKTLKTIIIKIFRMVFHKVRGKKDEHIEHKS